MAIPSALLNDIIITFEQLKKSLDSFDKKLASSHLPISLPNDTEILSSYEMLEQTRQYYSDIWHSGHQDGRRTQSSYGLVGATIELLDAAEHLNQCKDQLRLSISQIKKSDLSVVSAQLHQRSKRLNASMNQVGLGRLHLKQCYRHIPLLDSRPDNIRFSWYTSGRSIRKLTAHDAMEMLLKLDISQVHISKQIEKLSPLNGTTPLAQIQKQVPVVRANIGWKVNTNSWRRIAKNSPLPILVPLNRDEQLPVHNTLSKTPPEHRSRALRSDSIIDPEPFLPSLRIHLYRNQ